MKRTLIAAALAAATLLLPPGIAEAQQTKKVTFLTNYVFHGRHTPFFVARDKGFYKEAGFDVDIQPSTGSGFVVAAIDAGKADYGMADAGATVQAVAKGAKIKAFNVFMDVTTNGLASLKPLKSPEEVLGKQIAAGQNDSVRVILPTIFGLKGLDASKIDWQAADPGVYFSLLLGGRVDIITATLDGDIPALKKTAAQQQKEVFFASFAEWGYDIYGYFLLGKADRVAADPAEAKAFAAATMKAVKWAEENQEEAVKIMVAANPTLNAETVATQWKQAMLAIETPYVKQHGYGTATADRLQRTADLVSTALKLEPKPATDAFFDPGFVKK